MARFVDSYSIWGFSVPYLRLFIIHVFPFVGRKLLSALKFQRTFSNLIVVEFRLQAVILLSSHLHNDSEQKKMLRKSPADFTDKTNELKKAHGFLVSQRKLWYCVGGKMKPIRSYEGLNARSVSFLNLSRW